MTPDWLATEDGKRAVEAASTLSKRPEPCPDKNKTDEHRKGCVLCMHNWWWNDAAEIITAALPHLDRMFRERYAKELEAEAMRPHREGIPRNKGWHEAAEFLRAAAKRDGRTE